MQGTDNFNTNFKTSLHMISLLTCIQSVLLEVNPVLWRRTAGCFVVTVGNLMPALPLILQHRMFCQTRLFINSLIQKMLRFDNNMQTADSCERWSEREHNVFGTNCRLHNRTFRRVFTEVLVARGRFVNWSDEQVWSAEGVPLIISFTGEGNLRLKSSSFLKITNTVRKIITQC